MSVKTLCNSIICSCPLKRHGWSQHHNSVAHLVEALQGGISRTEGWQIIWEHQHQSYGGVCVTYIWNHSITMTSGKSSCSQLLHRFPNSIKPMDQLNSSYAPFFPCQGICFHVPESPSPHPRKIPEFPASHGKKDRGTMSDTVTMAPLTVSMKERRRKGDWTFYAM